MIIRFYFHSMLLCYLFFSKLSYGGISYRRKFLYFKILSILKLLCLKYCKMDSKTKCWSFRSQRYVFIFLYIYMTVWNKSNTKTAYMMELNLETMSYHMDGLKALWTRKEHIWIHNDWKKNHCLTLVQPLISLPDLTTYRTHDVERCALCQSVTLVLWWKIEHLK